MSGSGAEIKTKPKVGRNDPCPCGSRRKFKHCCGALTADPGSGSGADQGSPTAHPTSQRLQALIQAAEKHWGVGRWSEAISALQEAVRFFPTNPDVHRNLGYTYLGCGRFAEAAANLQRALELRPGSQSALRLLADALERARTPPPSGSWPPRPPPTGSPGGIRSGG